MRGVDDGMLYVIDGIPIVDRLDAVSASPIDADTIAGAKLAVAEINAAGGVSGRPAWRGSSPPR